jgi:hypothetical protein
LQIESQAYLSKVVENLRAYSFVDPTATWKMASSHLPINPSPSTSARSKASRIPALQEALSVNPLNFSIPGAK